jgi:hypothetical protein
VASFFIFGGTPGKRPLNKVAAVSDATGEFNPEAYQTTAESCRAGTAEALLSASWGKIGFVL